MGQRDSGIAGQLDKWERIAIRARIVSVRFESLVRRIGAINLSIAVLTVALAWLWLWLWLWLWAVPRLG